MPSHFGDESSIIETTKSKVKNMTLQDIIQTLNLQILAGEKDFASIEPGSGYASDLLSCVMAGAKHQGIWVTLQAHTNVVAVAALLELSAVIITEGAQPEPAMIDKAEQQGVTLLATPLPTFEVVGRLYQMGLQA
jgi:predicted transcriptional regulator